MAYTDPRTFTTAELVTATILNTHIKDQLRWLGGGSSLAANEGRGSTLPASPVDGQLFVYTADTSAGVEWLLKYNAGDAGSYKWHYIGGPPLYAEVLTSETTASSTYVALATAGPSIALPQAGDYMVTVGARILSNGDNGGAMTAYMSYDIGATGAVDADACSMQGQTGGGGNDGGATQRARRKTGLTAVTLTAKYKHQQNGGGSTAAFSNRWMTVMPVRIG